MSLLFGSCGGQMGHVSAMVSASAYDSIGFSSSASLLGLWSSWAVAMRRLWRAGLRCMFWVWHRPIAHVWHMLNGSQGPWLQLALTETRGSMSFQTLIALPWVVRLAHWRTCICAHASRIVRRGSPAMNPLWHATWNGVPPAMAVMWSSRCGPCGGSAVAWALIRARRPPRISVSVKFIARVSCAVWFAATSAASLAITGPYAGIAAAWCCLARGLVPAGTSWWDGTCAI